MTKPAPSIAPAPWNPPEPDPGIVYALKALQAGNASERQQKRALDFIVTRLCGTYDLPFRPGGQEGARATEFACGKLFVGQQIVRLLNLDASKLPKEGDLSHGR